MRLVTSDSGLLNSLLADGYDFFTGVPDSGLKEFISDLAGLPSDRHVTATWATKYFVTEVIRRHLILTTKNIRWS